MKKPSSFSLLLRCQLNNSNNNDNGDNNDDNCSVYDDCDDDNNDDDDDCIGDVSGSWRDSQVKSHYHLTCLL